MRLDKKRVRIFFCCVTLRFSPLVTQKIEEQESESQHYLRAAENRS